ncbi:MAG: hypothetical protein JWN73_4422 [Betaproteobacteria bacterium]|nr:hypothetical protein [Betaproteobacteria bacterium]
MVTIPKFTSKLPPLGDMRSLLLQWLVIVLMVVLYSPFAYLISRLMRGDILVGGIGFIVYLAIYCFIHLQLHKKGLVRLSHAAGLFVLASVIFCLVFYFDPLKGVPIH